MKIKYPEEWKMFVGKFNGKTYRRNTDRGYQEVNNGEEFIRGYRLAIRDVKRLNK